MRLPLFLVAAIVLVVFAIIATASVGINAGELFGVTWYTWLGASLLAYFVDLLVGGFGYANGGWGRHDSQRRPPA
jgi:hypothetical protein